MKRFCLCIVVCLSAMLVPLAAFAQENTPPPHFLQIFREEVKPGKNGAHEKMEAKYVAAFTKSHLPSNYTALVTIAGPNEAWFVTRYDSFAAWSKDLNTTNTNAAIQADMNMLDPQDGDLLNRTSSIFALYREDLSFRPGVNIPLMHNFSVTIVRVRPGHNNEFEDARKMVKAAHEKAGLKDNHSVYQVLSGYPSGTFLIITPYRDIADADNNPQIHGKTYTDAIGEDGQKKMRELNSSATISAETLFFSVNPKMSYPSKETIAADPDFWRPKAAVKSAAVATKPADKSSNKP
jgi:hypothetical protein